MEETKFEIVIGSWGSYNSRNERSLGSKWIDLSKYNSWEEIEEELKRQGFDLNGMDEELFIQDTNFNFGNFSGDYTHPKFLFEILKKSGVMSNPNTYKEALAYMEVENFDEFCKLVEKNGEEWDSDIQFYDSKDSVAFGQELISDWLPEEYFNLLKDYIDFDKYIENSDFHETSYGFIEIL